MHVWSEGEGESQIISTHREMGWSPWSCSGDACADWFSERESGQSIYPETPCPALAAAFIALSTL